jgi:retron-type reverse transcriptase
LLRGGVISSAFTHTYDDIISVENLLCAWGEFGRGKRKRTDVQEFQLRLMDNILSLQSELASRCYTHGGYEHFVVTDPKRRDIHKASVRDRLVHHAVYRILYPYFDNKFISDSYSCRNNKGTHKAIAQFRKYAGSVSENNTKTCWVLKCDIKKFFASIDQTILLTILEQSIIDKDTLGLLRKVIGSFNSGTFGVGLPLGNLTSQLLVNIYMNEFDQYVKHVLKQKYYIRYADDFVIVSQDRTELLKTLSYMIVFLGQKLSLSLHPNKVSIVTFASGVDFLGWVHFLDNYVLRSMTRRRVVTKFENDDLSEASRQSYLGILKRGDCYELLCKLTKTINDDN